MGTPKDSGTEKIELSNPITAMKRILLPTDFSDNAFEAITYAMLAFKATPCTFYLLHTYAPPIYQTEYLLGSPGLIGLAEVMQNTSQTRIEQLKSLLERQYGNPKHTFLAITAFNTFLNQVAETVKNEKIDLIVMGTKGATGAKEILFGTHTVHVIKNARCAVIAVPPHFKYEAPKEILFPTDYEVVYDKKMILPLLTLAQEHKSRINIIHVSRDTELTSSQKEHKSILDNLLGSRALFHLLPQDNTINAINTFQAKERINLLVMIRNKHTFLERLFIDPIIRRIGLHLTVPFMVLPQLLKRR
jgi:nucleotide-binding universal stress UspA family protein